MWIADMHCDTIMKLWYAELRGEHVSISGDGAFENQLHINLDKLKMGEYLLQNFAMFTDQALPADFNGQLEVTNYLGVTLDDTAGRMDPWTQVHAMIRVFKREMEANRDRIRQVYTYSDIEDNKKNGRLSAVLTTEEGCIVGSDLSSLDRLYDEGVRMMTVTWNYDNQLGHPNIPMEGFREDFSKFFRFEPDPDRGLTTFGKEAVEAMADKGILVDVSHLSDSGFADVADIVKGPFVASHSNARAIAGCHRNLTDEMIRTIGEHGGVIGLNFCPAFTGVGVDEQHCLTNAETLAAHAKHIINTGGEEVLGWGTDFDGIAPDGLGIRDASEMQMFVDGFRKAGISESALEKICYRNLLRVYKEVFPA